VHFEGAHQALPAAAVGFALVFEFICFLGFLLLGFVCFVDCCAVSNFGRQNEKLMFCGFRQRPEGDRRMG
jgi:hypothetical protein